MHHAPLGRARARGARVARVEVDGARHTKKPACPAH